MKHNVDKKIIGFDMDGVIIDHVANKISVAKQFGFKVKKKDTPSDTMRTLLPETAWDKIQMVLFDRAEVALTPPLMPGVENVLKNLVEKEIPYFLISRRKKSPMAIRLLKVRGLWPKYFNKKNAFFVKSREEKNEKSAELKVTHYFDDQISVLDKLSSVKNRFLFDNVEAFKNPPYRRIKSWKEVSKLI